MSYDFKKINELELVNEVPEGANVLIETEGTTKRLPSTAINNGYSKEEVYNKNEAYSKDEVYNKNEADEKFLTKETIAKPDWNQNDENAPDYVKNRTHWSEEFYRYIWDGNTEEKTIITPEGAPFSYVKVTNDILTAEDLIGATMIVNGVAENELPLAPEAILDETCVFDNGDGFVYVSWGIPVVMAFDKAMSVDSIECPSAGVYVMYVPSADPTRTPIYCSELSKTVDHKLDMKYLPNGYPYAEKGLITILPEQTEFEIDDGRTGYYITPCALDPDKQYVIAINGTQYDAQVSFDTNYNDGFKFVVETSDIGTVDVFSAFFMVVDDGYSVEDLRSIAIYENGEVVHKLDKKFLPDDVGGVSAPIVYIIDKSGDETVYSCSVDFETARTKRFSVPVYVKIITDKYCVREVFKVYTNGDDSSVDVHYEYYILEQGYSDSFVHDADGVHIVEPK